MTRIKSANIQLGESFVVPIEQSPHNAKIQEALEKEKLRHENLLLESKKKEIDNRADYTRIAQDAVEAFRRYAGYSDDEDI